MIEIGRTALIRYNHAGMVLGRSRARPVLPLVLRLSLLFGQGRGHDYLWTEPCACFSVLVGTLIVPCQAVGFQDSGAREGSFSLLL